MNFKTETENELKNTFMNFETQIGNGSNYTLL